MERDVCVRARQPATTAPVAEGESPLLHGRGDVGVQSSPPRGSRLVYLEETVRPRGSARSAMLDGRSEGGGERGKRRTVFSTGSGRLFARGENHDQPAGGGGPARKHRIRGAVKHDRRRRAGVRVAPLQRSTSGPGKRNCRARLRPAGVSHSPGRRPPATAVADGRWGTPVALVHPGEAEGSMSSSARAPSPGGRTLLEDRTGIS